MLCLVLFLEYRLQVVEAHWDQTKNMQTLFHEEETLLYHQPDMVRKSLIVAFVHNTIGFFTLSFSSQAFGEYIHKLLEVMEKKANNVNNVIAQVQTYLMASQAMQS